MSDLISRQKALDAIANLTCYGISEMENLCKASIADSEGWIGGILEAVHELQVLPSAEPEERTAKVKESWGLAMCCACEKRVFPCDDYCSHCGARLE